MSAESADWFYLTLLLKNKNNGNYQDGHSDDNDDGNDDVAVEPYRYI